MQVRSCRQDRHRRGRRHPWPARQARPPGTYHQARARALRRSVAPMRPKPAISIAHVEGSGTAAVGRRVEIAPTASISAPTEPPLPAPPSARTSMRRKHGDTILISRPRRVVGSALMRDKYSVPVFGTRRNERDLGSKGRHHQIKALVLADEKPQVTSVVPDSRADAGRH